MNRLFAKVLWAGLLMLIAGSSPLQGQTFQRVSQTRTADDEFDRRSSLELALNFGPIENPELRYRLQVGENLALRLGGWYERQRKNESTAGGDINRTFTRITVVPGVEWRFRLPIARLHPYVGIILPVQVHNARQRFDQTDGMEAQEDYETTLRRAWTSSVPASQLGVLERRSYTRVGIRPLAGLDVSITPGLFVGIEGSIGPWFLQEWQPAPDYNPELEGTRDLPFSNESSSTFEAWSAYASVKIGFRP